VQLAPQTAINVFVFFLNGLVGVGACVNRLRLSPVA
jgi:hypothetical protein